MMMDLTSPALRVQFEAAREQGYSGRAALHKVAAANGMSAAALEVALYPVRQRDSNEEEQ